MSFELEAWQREVVEELWAGRRPRRILVVDPRRETKSEFYRSIEALIAAQDKANERLHKAILADEKGSPDDLIALRRDAVGDVAQRWIHWFEARA